MGMTGGYATMQIYIIQTRKFKISMENWTDWKPGTVYLGARGQLQDCTDSHYVELFYM